MGYIELYLLSILLFVLAIKFLQQTRTRHKNLPPSPPSVPILGHLHLLKEPFHRSFSILSQKYGPIFSLRLGSRLAVVVSSPSAVEECFTSKNDIIFANRPYFWIGKCFGYNYTTLTTSPYGDHWRNLRRLCKLEIFSTNCLNLSSSIRRDETKNLLQQLFRSSNRDSTFVKVELKPMLSRLAFNITMRMIAGKQEANLDKFHKLIQEVLQLGISPNIGDFFPSLQWVEYFRGCKMKLTKLATEIDAFLQGVIDEYRRNKDIFERNKNYTMISQLLSLQESQPQYYTDDIIKGLLQDMILGATNAPVTTMEWTMSHLLNNLNAFEKIKAELDFHVGHDKLLDEADLPKLHYLQNVIFESLRLSPPVPLLVPHVSSDKCKIGGYEIPEDTILLVNVWAIHRDPKLWAEATSFKPERFENGKKIEGYYKMLPFGLGRRSCPGMDLGHRIVGLALGSLIQCFEWKRVGLEKIDMSEGKSLNLLKAEPLEALIRARKIAKKLL